MDIKSKIHDYSMLIFPAWVILNTTYHLIVGEYLFSIGYFSICMVVYLLLFKFTFGEWKFILRGSMEDTGVFVSNQDGPYHYINIPSGDLIHSPFKYKCAYCEQSYSRTMYLEDVTFRIDDRDEMVWKLACSSCHKKTSLT